MIKRWATMPFGLNPPGAPKGPPACGAIQRNGKPCRSRPVEVASTSWSVWSFPHCGKHLSGVPTGGVQLLTAWAEGEALRELREYEAQTGTRGWWSDPACWSWPVPDTGTARERFNAFHGSPARCAACGIAAGDTITDHDHDTGLIRGRLCRGCNLVEPGAGPDELLGKYRARTPADIVGLSERYWSPFGGHDEGDIARGKYDLDRSPADILPGVDD